MMRDITDSVVPGYQIAVIGVAGRFPDAAGPDAFWELLRSGTSPIRRMPPSRQDLMGVDLSKPSLEDEGIWHGGFLEEVDKFDPGFFRVTPREAAFIDPQHRLALELAWEALEDARIVPGQMRDLRTGVFVTASSDDYAILAGKLGVSAITQHTLMGLHRSMVANRVSYTLGLRGPSISIDTGQSSSLVAVHLACESLLRGESEIVLAGGVNLNIAPESILRVARFGSLSPDGRCYTFDARANGYVRGEGGGLVILKPLARAIADGDRVYCVISGSAVNNDGGGPGIAVPDQSAQEEVLRLAYERAGVDLADVQYVELHGTGTKVGDPIEAAALGAVLGAARTTDHPLLVGSVKTNVGHLEGAAGITGLIKVLLALRHRELPPSLNFEVPNPRIPLEELNLRVHTELGRWARPGEPLTAGVSSFGMGGTNCHLVLREAPRTGEVSLQPGDVVSPVSPVPAVV
ncbi:polyketide synthase, partial [Frankia sp. Cr1]|uniref:beta-ketoacyl [acyl carrier protein] synthase domain-containing protein n=1 Tax=Frankia sp. Cr1 TaxID=3073931 RepID=UPI002AD1E79E